MVQLDLNISTRPFKPYRAVNFALALGLLLLVAVSAYQVYSYRQYSSLAASIRDEERKAKEESETLTREVVALNAKMTGGSSTAKLSEVEFLNGLLVRKSFSYTRVFSSLEALMPEDVYLVGLQPFTDAKGETGLNMTVRGRSLSDAASFIRVLENSGTFTDVTVAVEEKKDPLPGGEVELTLSTYYHPERNTQ